MTRIPPFLNALLMAAGLAGDDKVLADAATEFRPLPRPRERIRQPRVNLSRKHLPVGPHQCHEGKPCTGTLEYHVRHLTSGQKGAEPFMDPTPRVRRTS